MHIKIIFVVVKLQRVLNYRPLNYWPLRLLIFRYLFGLIVLTVDRRIDLFFRIITLSVNPCRSHLCLRTSTSNYVNVAQNLKCGVFCEKGVLLIFWPCCACGSHSSNSEPSPSITHTSTSIYFCRRNQPTEIRYDKIEN